MSAAHVLAQLQHFSYPIFLIFSPKYTKSNLFWGIVERKFITFGCCLLSSKSVFCIDSYKFYFFFFLIKAKSNSLHFVGKHTTCRSKQEAVLNVVLSCLVFERREAAQEESEG